MLASFLHIDIVTIIKKTNHDMRDRVISQRTAWTERYAAKKDSRKSFAGYLCAIDIVTPINST